MTIRNLSAWLLASFCMGLFIPTANADLPTVWYRGVTVTTSDGEKLDAFLETSTEMMGRPPAVHSRSRLIKRAYKRSITFSEVVEENSWKDLPVEQVSWEDIQLFINKLNQSSGFNFRLPTEAEWEYACKSGSNKRSQGYLHLFTTMSERTTWVPYKWRNRVTTTNYVNETNSDSNGIFGLGGSILEICQDWFDEDYYSSSSPRNPKGSSDGSFKVVRGVNYTSLKNGQDVQSTGTSVCIFRTGRSVSDKQPDLGFRLALDFNGDASTSLKEITVENSKFQFVLLKGGEFNMGRTDNQDYPPFEPEKPLHKVELSPFYLGKYEVTQGQWYAIMGSRPSRFVGEKLKDKQLIQKDGSFFSGEFFTDQFSIVADEDIIHATSFEIVEIVENEDLMWPGGRMYVLPSRAANLFQEEPYAAIKRKKDDGMYCTAYFHLVSFNSDYGVTDLEDIWKSISDRDDFWMRGGVIFSGTGIPSDLSDKDVFVLKQAYCSD